MPFLDPIYILSILVAITVHEWAHAYVATRLGDPTPHTYGRLTLNPVAHLDPLGALMFLFAGFGWAKPVPINPIYFKNTKIGTLLTAAAGPFSNLILAALAFISLSLLLPGSGNLSAWELLSLSETGSAGHMFLARFLGASLFVNLGLMAFNLIPIAPLDGSKVLQAFIPLRYEDIYEEYMQRGFYILIALLIAEQFLRIPLISAWVTTIIDWVLLLLQGSFGWL